MCKIVIGFLSEKSHFVICKITVMIVIDLPIMFTITKCKKIAKTNGFSINRSYFGFHFAYFISNRLATTDEISEEDEP